MNIFELAFIYNIICPTIWMMSLLPSLLICPENSKLLPYVFIPIILLSYTNSIYSIQIYYILSFLLNEPSSRNFTFISLTGTLFILLNYFHYSIPIMFILITLYFHISMEYLATTTDSPTLPIHYMEEPSIFIFYTVLYHILYPTLLDFVQ